MLAVTWLGLLFPWNKKHCPLWLTPGQRIISPVGNPVNRLTKPRSRMSRWQCFYASVTKLCTKHLQWVWPCMQHFMWTMNGRKRPQEATEGPWFILTDMLKWDGAPQQEQIAAYGVSLAPGFPEGQAAARLTSSASTENTAKSLLCHSLWKHGVYDSRETQANNLCASIKGVFTDFIDSSGSSANFHQEAHVCFW